MSEHSTIPRDFLNVTSDFIKYGSVEVVGELVFAAPGIIFLLAVMPDAIPYYAAALATYATLTASSLASRVEEEDEAEEEGTEVEEELASAAPDPDEHPRQFRLFMLGYALSWIGSMSGYFLTVSGVAVVAGLFTGSTIPFMLAFWIPIIDFFVADNTEYSLMAVVGNVVMHVLVGVFLLFGLGRPNVSGEIYRGGILR